MRKAKLLSTVAAALLFGVGAASAQGMGKDTPERAPAAQQSAPAEKVAPSMKNGDHKAPQTTGQATPDDKSGKAKETTGQAPKSEPKSDMGQRSPSGTPRRVQPCEQRCKQVELGQHSGGFSVYKIQLGGEPRDDRTRRGWFSQADNRTTHQDQFGHQGAEG